GPPWPVLPQLPEPVQDEPAVGVLAPQLAGDASERVPPLVQHPAEVLPADAADEAVADEVIAELGQRPPAVGKAQLGRGLFGQAADGATPPGGEPRRCPKPSPGQQAVKAAAVEQAQIGVGGVDVDAQKSSNVTGGMARAVEQHALQASALPRWQRLLQQAVNLVEFCGGGGTNRRGAAHGFPSSSAPLLHSTKT